MMSTWVSVKDELPVFTVDEFGNPEWPIVQVWENYHTDRRIVLGHFIDRHIVKEWRFEGANFDATPYVTHWRYLDDGPEGC